MMDRCYNPEHMHYRSYGGRGIDVCERWHDIAIFIADNEGKKLPGLSIDRRDNDLGYFPENCIWSDRKQQGRNRRTNVSIDFRGKTQCMQDWSDELGIPKGVIWKRLKLGQTMDEVVASQAARGPRRKRAA